MLKNGWDKIQKKCFESSKKAGWWNIYSNMTYIIPTKLCLIHSEISEAMEGHRKGLMDSHLPHRSSIDEKLAYNAKREDHKSEVRAAEGGKSY